MVFSANDDRESFEGDQCDQIAWLFFNFWPFTSIKTCPAALKIAKVGPKFSQIEKPLKIAQDFEDLPNLVTL